MERYFYTEYYPYRWTSGAGIYRLDPDTHDDITSLERAKEIAESRRVISTGDGRRVTTYGVEYTLEDQ
jgi:hypothetical protein